SRPRCLGAVVRPGRHVPSRRRGMPGYRARGWGADTHASRFPPPPPQQGQRALLRSALHPERLPFSHATQASGVEPCSDPESSDAFLSMPASPTNAHTRCQRLESMMPPSASALASSPVSAWIWSISSGLKPVVLVGLGEKILLPLMFRKSNMRFDSCSGSLHNLSN